MVFSCINNNSVKIKNKCFQIKNLFAMIISSPCCNLDVRFDVYFVTKELANPFDAFTNLFDLKFSFSL